MLRIFTLLHIFTLLILLFGVTADPCLGEYQYCSHSGSCVLIPDDCSICTYGQYLCPDRQTCVNSAEDYVNCPAIKGTHLDWELPIEQRLDYLVKNTILQDRIAQLTNDAPSIPYLSIPSYNWLNDDEHGVMQTHATIFPDGCGLGATWSKKTLREVGYAIGLEARGLHNGFVHEGNRGQGINGMGITMYAPNMNTVRDPRWGRAQEVFSEDPYLSSRLTVQFVEGGQGNNSAPYLMAGACCKHYAAYDLESLPVQRYNFSAQVDVRNFWETYLPVFRACIREADAVHVMCSYNAINGIPTCGDPKLLNGILREQWDWKGFVVSDYDAWAQIKDTHFYCADYECAAAVGINAGLDQEGGGTLVINHMMNAINHGRVNESSVDSAFRRLFRVRMLLGMLDPPHLNPWNYISNDSSVVEGPAHLDLARKAAQESICLYKNKNNVLPLNVSEMIAQGNQIAIIGPQAVQLDLLLGNYAPVPDAGIVSIHQGLFAALQQKTKMNCSYEFDIDYYQSNNPSVPANNEDECCAICSTVQMCSYFTYYDRTCYLKSTNAGRVVSQGRISGGCYSRANIKFEKGCNDVQCSDTSGFPNAMQAAQSSDIVIVTLGLDQNIEEETRDRADINLPSNQYSLVQQLRTAVPNIPIIGVLIHGGTFAMGALDDELDAIVDAWYPGMQGGLAIADVLVGNYNPAGRTPVTYYKKNADLPPAGTMNLYSGSGSLGLTYRFFTGEPQYPFGYGLSYTSFKYSNLMIIGGSSFDACDVISLQFDITNVGSLDGDEVAQVYLRQPNSTVPSPNIRLAAFERVFITAGQTVTVEVQISPEYHTVVYDGEDIFHPVIMSEKGDLEIFVGGGQPAFSSNLMVVCSIINTKNFNSCT